MTTKSSDKMMMSKKLVSTNLKPTLYSVDDVAKMLSISSRMMWKLIYNCEIPHVKIGRRVLINEIDINRFIEDHTVPAFDAQSFARKMLYKL